MASTIKIASYAITLGVEKGNLMVLLTPRVVDPNVPDELKAMGAVISPSRTLDWKNFKVEEHHPQQETIAIRDAKSAAGPVLIVSTKDLAAAFEIHKDKLAKTIPALTSPEAVIAAAINGARMAYGAYYPGAAIEPEDDVLNVVSDTKFPVRSNRSAKPGRGVAAPKRASNADRIKVWLGGNA